VSRRRLLFLVLAPLVLVAAGTAGYALIEPEYSPFDALYMTVITLTTVGYEEVHTLSPAGRVFTIFLLLGGVITFFYTATELVRIVVGGEVQAHIGRRRMARSLAGLRDHLIICGYGRMGRFVCREFSQRGVPFVVIDLRPELLQDFDLPHGLALAGDATDDDVLHRAGVGRARALVAVTPSDADNLFITLSARLLNDRLFIVARAEDEPAEHKLKRAGANRVVSPYASGGFRVAQAVLRPAVVDFIELATRTGHLDLQIEEVQVQPGSPLAGADLQASRLRLDLGVIIVAIKRGDGAMLFNPPGDAVMAAGDTLIALGGRPQLDRLEALAGKRPDGGA
jgi:voltage-gated potassium channel